MLSLGGPIGTSSEKTRQPRPQTPPTTNPTPVISLFLLIINAAHYQDGSVGHDRYIIQYTWRVLFGIGICIPLSVFYFRLKMQNPKLYRRNAIRRSPPYSLIIRRYWKTLLGTAGTWFLYDFVT